MAGTPKKDVSDVSIEDIRSCWKVPAIAHFCSLFRSTFLLPDFEIEELEEALFLDAGVEQSDFITNLVVQLLRGIHGRKLITCEDHLKWLRSVMKERWELGEKRVNPLNSQDVTFKMLPTLTKVEILHALCDYRLDAADVSVLKDYDGDNLRVEPLGTDRTGATYWYFYGTRLYKEDRQLSTEEKEARHKQKLKEKRRRKREHLKAIKKLKEVRKKQKLKEKGKKGRNKGCPKDKKKKKKSPKTSNSDSEGHSGMIDVQSLLSSSTTSNKSAKKGLKKKNSKTLAKAASLNKLEKLKSCNRRKPMDSGEEVVNQSKNKSKRTSGKKQIEKLQTNGKKQQTVTKERVTKTALSKKKKTEEEKVTGKGGTKTQNKTNRSSSTKNGNKGTKGQQQDDGSCKSRKRKVIKSKAIISESEEDSEEDQPLKKVAKKGIVSKAVCNNPKSDKIKMTGTFKSNKMNKKNSVSKSVTNTKRDDCPQKEVIKKGKNEKKSVEVSKYSSEEDMSSAVSIPETSDTDSDSEDDIEPPRWHLVCHSQEDWERLTDFFKKSKVKCEKELYKTLASDFLPEINSLFAAKEKALRKKLQELAPRRASSRVVIMQLKREEEERLKSIEEAEESSRRQQFEEDKRQKMKLRNKPHQQPSHQEQPNESESTKSMQSTANKSKVASRTVKTMKTKKENIHAKLQQVYDAVGTHEDSWPFMEPVDEAYAPAYYQIIIKPMCLNIIQKKITRKDYKTKHEFERDMNQLFTNCLEYNGPGNEYTLMAENLKSCLEYNMEQVFPKQSLDKDDIDSDCDSVVSSDHFVHQRPPQRQSAKNANTRLEKLEDKVYARLRGLSSNESSIMESRNSSRTVSDDDDDTEVDKKENEKPNADDQKEFLKDLKEDVTEEGENEGTSVITTGISPHLNPSTNATDIPSDTSSSKSSSTEVYPYDDQKDLQTRDVVDVKLNTQSPSINDDQNVTLACRPKGVIAFAPCISSQIRENADIDKNDQRYKDHKGELMQNSGTGQTNETDCKEEPPNGQNLLTPSQVIPASKINRVKPVQNVRPYIPDSHSKEDNDTSITATCDQHELTQSTSQVPPAMIDLNSRRPDVLKQPVSSSCDLNATFYSKNSLAVNLGLNEAIPQENFYTTSIRSQEFQHSKQSQHSGNKSKQQHKRTKSKDLPELPAPLTVLPVGESTKQHIPTVQPLLPSSNSLQASQWYREQATNVKGDIFQRPQLEKQSAFKSSEGFGVCDRTQKLWHPLGVEERIASNYSTSSQSLYPHALHSSDKFNADRVKLSQASSGQPVQTNSQSSNILQSLLYKQSSVSEHQQPNDVSNNLNNFSESSRHFSTYERQGIDTIQEHNTLPKSSRDLKVPSNERIHYRESSGQSHSDKDLQHYRSRGYDDMKLAQREIEVKAMPAVCSHSQQGSANLHQPVGPSTFHLPPRQPENAIQDETFVAKQDKIASISQFPHPSPFSSSVVDQRDGRHADNNTRGVEAMMPVRNSASYLSMLTTDATNIKQYKDHSGIQGFPRPQTTKNQSHSSPYADQLRMHASQASASYSYSSGSNLNHLFSPRQKTPVGHTNSAFKPHDPYSSQSAFRVQRPGHHLYRQYMCPQDAEQLARQQYQQHMHQRGGIGAGLASYHAQPTLAQQDISFYTQHGIGGALLDSQAVSGLRTPMQYDPSLLSHPSRMQHYK